MVSHSSTVRIDYCHDQSASEISERPTYLQSSISTSSAFPVACADELPMLSAMSHTLIRRSVDREGRFPPLQLLEFRELSHRDDAEVRALHAEWFPVRYDDQYYDAVVNGGFTSIAAMYRSGRSGYILGLGTLQTDFRSLRFDMPYVLDGPNVEDRVAYIPTLGVIDEYRRKGLASELLRRCINKVRSCRPAPKQAIDAIYLHVATYNDPAIRLYERTGFVRLHKFTAFYRLHGQDYDSYLYAIYLNGCSPPRSNIRSSSAH